jgi:phage-related protein
MTLIIALLINVIGAMINVIKPLMLIIGAKINIIAPMTDDFVVSCNNAHFLTTAPERKTH